MHKSTLKKSILVLGVIFVLAIPSLQVKAAPTNNNVAITSSSETSSQIGPGQTNTFTVAVGNTGGNVANILVDLELHDANNNKVAQKFFDNQLIPPTAPITFQLTTPNNLANGTYKFSVGLFQTNWASLISWNGDLQSFVVGTGGSNGGDGHVVMVNNSVNPGTISAGQTAMLSAQLASPNTANTILLDFELRDSNHNKVFQKFWDNLVIPQRGSPGQVVFTVQTPPALLAGTYYFSIGIFQPQWHSLIHWYNNTQTLTVGQQNQTGQIAIQQIQRPKTNISQGQSFGITATLISQNADSAHVKVEIDLVNNASGQVADSSLSASQTLISNTPANFTLTSNPSLPAGNYSIVIKVFNSDGSLKQQFTGLGSVTIL